MCVLKMRCAVILCANAHISLAVRRAQNAYDGKTSSDANEPFETIFYFHIHVLNSLKFSRCEDNEMTDNRNNQHITSKVFCRKMQTHAMAKNMRNSPKNQAEGTRKKTTMHLKAMAEFLGIRMPSIWSSSLARIASKKMTNEIKRNGHYQKVSNILKV